MAKAAKRIAITDSPQDFIKNVLYFVSDLYDFEITHDRDADYIFYSVDGYDVLKYSGVRIFVTGENVTPNFAVTDYAMAFDKLTFGDRYIWFPLIKLYREAYEALVTPRRPAAEVLKEKSSFCAYVMSNTKNSAEERTQIFDLLSAYKTVNSGGKWRNNIGGRVKNKLEFQAKHKFVIAFENSSSPGYLTEKFAEAAAADAVPIYWGDPDIGKTFNTKSFINCHDFNSLEEAATYVQKVDQDDRLYKEILSEPWFPNGIEPECLKDDTFRSFLDHIFCQDLNAAFRRNRSRWGQKTEERLYNMYHRPHIHSLTLLRKVWRRFYYNIIPSRRKW